MSIKFLNGIDVDNGVLYTDTSNNRVGINTSSPQVPLEAKYTGTTDEILRIVGAASGKPQMTFYNASTLHTKIVAAGNNDFSITNTHSTGDMFFGTGGATRLHIEANGNVGIGTINPTQKLHVSGNARVTGAYYDSNNSAGTSGQVLSSTGSGTDWVDAASGGGIDGSGSTNYIAKWSDSDTITNSVIYDNGTNVGIGTTSPSSQLGSTKVLDISSTGNGEIILDHTDAGTSSDIGLYSWNRNNDHLAHIKASCDGATDSAFISFHAQPTGGSFSNAASNEKMRIKSNGNVGIGTTGPSKKLHVAGTARVDSTFYLGTDDSCVFFRYYNALIITNNASATISLGGGPGSVNNNVSIPNGFLDVSGYIRGKNYFYLEDAQGTLRTTLRSESTYATLDNGTNTLNTIANAHIFLRSTTEVMRIHTNNNVGIGTTNPQKKLHVSSGDQSTARIRLSNTNTSSGGDNIELVAGVHNVTQDGFSIYNASGGGTQFVIQGGGSVGIGATSPSEKLEVNGTVKATATTDAYKGYIKQNVISYGAEKVENSNYYFTAYNTTATVTSAQAYNRIVAAYSGRVKKVYIRHAGASTPTATAVNFKKHVNGTTSSTVYAATVANTASTNMTAYYEFADSDFTFNAGDLVGLLYQTTDAFGTASKTMGGVAVTITLEYNIT